MINRRFLNFKTYDAFINKLDGGEIDRDNAIVFIQDKSCIWARGKEYMCIDPSTADIQGNTLTFKNGDDSVVFTVTQNGGTLEFVDSNGNTSSATYILKRDFDNSISNINNLIGSIEEISQGYALTKDLKRVAFTGDYSDLQNTPTIPQVISQLSSTSENPVQSKVIYAELQNKANNADLAPFITSTQYNEGLGTKQDKLTAGYGISRDALNRNIIESTVDTSVYVIVTSLPDPSEANQDKIYIRETQITPGQYKYEQFRVKNGQWALIGDMNQNVDLSSYLTINEAENTYQHIIDDYLTSADLTPYAKLTDIQDVRSDLSNYALISFVQQNFQAKGDYATKDYVDNAFVKWIDVYNTAQGGGSSSEDTPQSDDQDDDNNNNNNSNNDQPGGGTTIINPTTTIIQQIELDDELSLSSQNGVMNYVIKAALDNKADASELRNYATTQQLNTKADVSSLQNYVNNSTFNTALEQKQDVLTPGRGISIINNVISSTLDTSVYIFADDFPSLDDINPDKIYIIEGEDNGEPIYTQYRYNGEEWIPLGQITPEVDLTTYLRSDAAAQTYLSKSEAAQTYQVAGNYQPAGNYANADEVARTYQEKGDYISRGIFDAFILNVNNTFQRKGGYALASDVSNALTLLQQLIDQKYVLKIDVPMGDQYSTSDPVQINIGTQDGNGGSSSSSSSNMVTLTVQQYENLVEAGLVNENTYYFTYEGEPETTEWHFGDSFPITFGNSTWGFGDKFPITLTDGSTPDSFGTFPINLT